MIYKSILLILTVSIMLSGCIDSGADSQTGTTEEHIPGKIVKINYFDQNTIINGEDFPGFKLANNVYYVSQENLSLTLEAESGHGVYEVDANATIPPGYRIYGGSELHNLSERYILLQYKVFDKNDSLVDTINATAEDIYIKRGYKYVPLNDSYNGTRVVLELNGTNNTDKNVVIILFGFGTVIGKIGVQDSKDKSLNEALEVLDIVSNRLTVKTKDVEVTKLDTIRSGNMSDITSDNMSNPMTENMSKTYH